MAQQQQAYNVFSMPVAAVSDSKKKFMAKKGWSIYDFERVQERRLP